MMENVRNKSETLIDIKKAAVPSCDVLRRGSQKVLLTLSIGMSLMILASDRNIAVADEGYRHVTVNIKNNSPYKIKVTITGGYGKAQTYGIDPGKYLTVPQQVYFAFGPYVQGSRTLGVTTDYNGNKRTGYLPIYVYGSSYHYASGIVFKRSPGILGLKDNGK